MLEKTFSPTSIEGDRYAEWEASGAFAARPQGNGVPWTVMMPPPNVTGSLHMGHALNMTLQDVLTRYYRMKGRDALWQPGTDHAGIATQMVVERQLGEQGTDRRELGRDAFIEKVWEWKAISGGTITRQLRRLGTTPDWPRERFTMDEGLSAAVTKVFVQLYRDGLLYKDKRLVNWDPKLLTAISDLEVEQVEVNSHLWHFRYPLADDPSRHIVVATTRPETMLGDTAVAVHPDDPRYKDLIGKQVRLPLVGRLIPIVGDDYADPETGSGAVKITPAHDFNDFEVGRRQNLEMVNIFDQHAILNDAVPEAYRGLDRYDARKRVVADLETLDLVEKIEPHTHKVPHGDRSGVVIEPWLSDQWYVDAATLAAPAIKAVEDGRTQFVPKTWENTYFAWLKNIQPWCVSRQLWWGHQIPAWYGPDGAVFVAETEGEAAAEAERHYGAATALTRDADVLDTWFSSALWPFSTLGWPEADKADIVKRYYPGEVLVTGFDIIFFWVARMMMMGLHFMGDVPFRTVYIHALVRDEKGQKMSKSKGNIIDPLDLIEKFGADALRMTLTAMAAQGRDIKLAESRVEGYRNFATKLWNAARFSEMNGCAPVAGFDPAAVSHPVNRWIVTSVVDTAHAIDTAIEAYRFNDAATAIYQFTWGTFCDWYLEFTKPILNGEDPAAIAETRATTAWVIDQILILLNPIMPYLTEELYARLADRQGQHLLTASWPDYTDIPKDDGARADLDWVVRLIQTVRSIRSDMNVPASAQVPLMISGLDDAGRGRLETYRDLVLRLARLVQVDSFDGEPPKGSASAILDGATLVLPLADIIDLDKERARLSKEQERVAKDIQKIDQKLANEQFLAKAPEEVVAEQRDRRADLVVQREGLEQALSRLG